MDVFYTTKPDREYTEIARIICGDTDDSWNLEQILMKAREIGADAIIVIGRSCSYGVVVPVGNMAYAEAEGYGFCFRSNSLITIPSSSSRIPRTKYRYWSQLPPPTMFI